jgi:N-acetylmuramoyl-L-alanine amidase
LAARLAIRLVFQSVRLQVNSVAVLTALILGSPCLAAQQATQAPAQFPALPPAPRPPSAPAVPRFVVVIDAAHGGDDPGGKFGSLLEKDLTLALSVRLRSLLGARGIAVVTTRESDAAVPPDRRAEIANHAAAQACLSLHATQTGSGVHMFVSSLAPQDPARIPAWKTAQSAWVTRSLALEGALNSALLQAGMNVTLGRTAVSSLDSLNCPAIALEFAPLSGEKGQPPTAALDDPAYQAKLAEALAAGLLAWQAEAHQP